MDRPLRAVVFVLAIAGCTRAGAEPAYLGELSSDQREVWNRVISQASCPCNCPMTLGGCLTQKPKCQRATILARYAARQSQQGLTPLDILTSIAEGFSASSATAAIGFLPGRGYNQKGKAKAKLQLVEFADFRCPHCREASHFLSELASKWSDRVEITFKHFPLQSLEPSLLAAEAAEAAGVQGKFWPYHDLLFKNQESVGREDLLRYAKELGLDLRRFGEDLDKRTHRAKVLADKEEGTKAGVQGTPAVFVNGREFRLERTLENFRDRTEYDLEPECKD